MTPPTSPAEETLNQLQHLAAALKAPRITQAAARLADHARDASGAELRIRATGLPARKTLEDFDRQPAVRSQITALASPPGSTSRV